MERHKPAFVTPKNLRCLSIRHLIYNLFRFKTSQMLFINELIYIKVFYPFSMIQSTSFFLVSDINCLLHIAVNRLMRWVYCSNFPEVHVLIDVAPCCIIYFIHGQQISLIFI